MQIQFADTLTRGRKVFARPIARNALPGDLDRALAEAAKADKFAGQAGRIHEGFVERDGAMMRMALVGIGARAGEDRPTDNCPADDRPADDRPADLEKAGGALTAKYLCSGETTLAIDLADAGLSAADTAAFLLGVRLRAWRWDKYRTTLKDDRRPTLKNVVVTGAPAGAQDAWARESALADGVEFARELVTEPANILYPESFVERVRAALEGTDATITVLDDARMEALGMGALLGVGQGSTRPSRILAVELTGGEEGDAPIAFVGKGVTFDSGGISIKPGAGMEDMKWDMGGAGAVAGAMVALARRGAKANIVGVMGLVENMPDGNAQRPGDVVTSMSGQTIEVINTDAEGRLVLCDVLHWTQETYRPARIVDFATLTGAMLIALGHERAGVFANDDALAEDLLAAGGRTGDKLWRMPLGPAYDKLLDSAIADMKNVGPRHSGSITAAQFLQRFIQDGVAWAHCDIAGMAWSDKAGSTYDKGATGYGVRLMDALVRATAEG